MNMPRTATIFEQNSEAVRILQNQNHKEAISQLRQVLAQLMALQNGFRLEPTMTGHGSQAGAETIMDIALLHIPVGDDNPSIPEGGSPRMIYTAGLDDDQLFQPFEMAFSTALMNYQGERGVNLTRSFVMYNLGLSYHRKARMTRCAASVEKALRWYQMSFHTIQEARGDGDQEDVILLVLALLNNMGHLWSDHFDRSKECIALMGSVIAENTWTLDAERYPQFGLFHLTVMAAPKSVFEKAAAA